MKYGDVNMKNDIILSNDLKISEYSDLILTVGWKRLSDEQIEKAIKNSMYVVKASIDGKTVGMGRLVGDHSSHGMLTGIIVHPDYRKNGIGKMIVLNIKDYVYNMIKEGEQFMIELCPVTGTRDFYIDCGFKHKPEMMDGMYLWIKK
jgi:N-acetylglutamate synthase-like GNAT family acetyltransferase